MNLPQTIEGIEALPELEIVLGLGAHKLQGFFGSRPLKIADADVLVRAHAKPRLPAAHVGNRHGVRP
jgi:EAL domain-containing protein (putative c-di-GMP-specific phosphodiesterase class I)